MKIRRERNYTDHGQGFPVILTDVPLVEIQGEWSPFINYRKLDKEISLALARKAGPLTGNQVRFIRLRLGMTLDELAAKFDHKRQAVMKWEKHGPDPTQMRTPTEIVFRLMILREEGVAQGQLGKALEGIESAIHAPSEPLIIPASRVAVSRRPRKSGAAKEIERSASADVLRQGEP